MPRPARRWIVLGLGAVALAGAAYYYLTEDDSEDSNADPNQAGQRGQQTNGRSSTVSKSAEYDIKDLPSAEAQQQVDINAHVDAHFQSIQAIAKETTVATLLRPLAENVKGMDDMDASIGRLQREKQSLTTAEKLELWQTVLERVLCRFVCVVWLVPMLHMTIRVQLNVLGRTLYLQSSLSDWTSQAAEPCDIPADRRRRAKRRGTVLSTRAQEAFLSLGEHVGAVGYTVIRDMAHETAQKAAAALVEELGSVAAETNVAQVRSAIGGLLATFEREQLEQDAWRRWEAAVAPSEERVKDVLDGAELTPAERFEVEGMWHETLGIYRSEAFRTRYLAGAARVLAAAMLRRVRIDQGGKDGRRVTSKNHNTDDESTHERDDTSDCDESTRNEPIPLVALLPVVAREVELAMDPQSEYYAVLSEDTNIASMVARVYANGFLS